MAFIKCIAVLAFVPVFSMSASTYQVMQGFGGSATTTYGNLSTMAVGGGSFVDYFSASGFDDIMTFYGVLGSGLLTYDANYSFNTGNGSGEVSQTFCFGISACLDSGANNGNAGQGIFTEQVPFTFGIPFHLALGLRSDVTDFGEMGGVPFAYGQVNIRDLTVSCVGTCNSNIITFTSASNTSYPFTNAVFIPTPQPSLFVPTPEPSTVASGALSALGLLFVACLHRRKPNA
jgi:hypothetical protein